MKCWQSVMINFSCIFYKNSTGLSVFRPAEKALGGCFYQMSLLHLCLLFPLGRFRVYRQAKESREHQQLQLQGGQRGADFNYRMNIVSKLKELSLAELLPLFSLPQILLRLSKLCVQEGLSGRKSRKQQQRLLRNMGAHAVVLELLQIPYEKVTFGGKRALINVVSCV